MKPETPTAANPPPEAHFTLPSGQSALGKLHTTLLTLIAGATWRMWLCTKEPVAYLLLCCLDAVWILGNKELKQPSWQCCGGSQGGPRVQGVCARRCSLPEHLQKFCHYPRPCLNPVRDATTSPPPWPNTGMTMRAFPVKNSSREHKWNEGMGLLVQL